MSFLLVFFFLTFFYVCFSPALIQKRLKKEKKTKRKLQEALEYESKRRDQAEQTLQQTTASEHAHTPNGEQTHATHTELHSWKNNLLEVWLPTITPSQHTHAHAGMSLECWYIAELYNRSTWSINHGRFRPTVSSAADPSFCIDYIRNCSSVGYPCIRHSLNTRGFFYFQEFSVEIGCRLLKGQFSQK